MHRSMKAGVMGLGLSLALALVATASTVLRFDAKDLTDHATVIVHGKVTSKVPRALSENVIVTNYQVEVLEGLKGLEEGSLKDGVFSFSAYGGVTAERGSGISGAASYAKGEEILVFLTGENKYGCRAAVGLAQGKYTIREVEGRKLAFRDLEGLRLMDRKSGAIEEAKAEQGVAFDELLAGVKRRLAENKTKRK